MKDAGKYKAKLATLLKRLPKTPKDANVELQDPIRAMVLGILGANATARQVERGFKAVNGEYVDFNELRVSPERDIVECIGENYPDAYGRARMIRTSLGGIFAQCSTVSMEYLDKLPRRDVRRRLSELGLDEYAAGVTMLWGLGLHAVAVDDDLALCLELKGCVHPGADIADIQGFVERAVPKQRAHAAHQFFRDLIQSNAKAMAKRRKAEAKARAAAEAAAKAAEEAAEAERLAAEQAKKAAEEKAKQLAESKAKAKKKAAAKKRAAARKKAPARKKAAAKKTVRKTAKKATKKATKKTTKKTAKKAVKKTTKKTTKKTARKPAKPGRKTSAAAKKTPARTSSRTSARKK